MGAGSPRCAGRDHPVPKSLGVAPQHVWVVVLAETPHLAGWRPPCLAGAAFLHPAVAGDHRRGKQLLVGGRDLPLIPRGRRFQPAGARGHVGVHPPRPTRDLSTVLCAAWDRPAGVRWGRGDFCSSVIPAFFFFFFSPVCLSVRPSVCFSAGVSLRESLILVPRLRSAVCTARKGRIKSRAAL